MEQATGNHSIIFPITSLQFTDIQKDYVKSDDRHVVKTHDIENKIFIFSTFDPSSNGWIDVFL